MPSGRYHQRTSFKDVDPLTCPDYEEFLSLSRCLHISDVEEAQRRGMLVPQPIRNSRTLGCKTRVLWFAPTQSMEQHNFYGNVSYVISWKVVLAKMGPHLYSIDQAIYADRAFTRILLTKKNYDVLLQNVNLHSDGSAILKRSNNYVHAAKCYCKNRTGLHELQIGIEVTDEDARWLYNHCTAMANNHTLANTPMVRQVARKDGKIKKYAPFKCFLYNTTLNTQCPNQDSRKKMEATLAFMNIAFSRSLPLDAGMDTDKENVNYNNRSYPAHGIAASTPSKIKPKAINASSLAVGTVIPSSNQPKTRPLSSRVHADAGQTVGNTVASAPLTWSVGEEMRRKQSEQAELLRRLQEKRPSSSATLDSSNTNRTVTPYRPNKLPPISRTIVVPAAGSGQTGQSVGHQHGTVRPLASVSAYNSHPSYWSPPSPNPTFERGRVRPNESSARSSSAAYSPVTSPVRNDWGPLIGTHSEPERSFAERLRRFFMCCC